MKCGRQGTPGGLPRSRFSDATAPRDWREPPRPHQRRERVPVGLLMQAVVVRANIDVDRMSAQRKVALAEELFVEKPNLLAFVHGHRGQHDPLRMRTDVERFLLLAALSESSGGWAATSAPRGGCARLGPRPDAGSGAGPRCQARTQQAASSRLFQRLIGWNH